MPPAAGQAAGAAAADFPQASTEATSHSTPLRTGTYSPCSCETQRCNASSSVCSGAVHPRWAASPPALRLFTVQRTTAGDWGEHVPEHHLGPQETETGFLRLGRI